MGQDGHHQARDFLLHASNLFLGVLDGLEELGLRQVGVLNARVAKRIVEFDEIGVVLFVTCKRGL